MKDRFTASPDVLAAHLAGEAVLLDLRDKNYYRLNETAAVVWKAIEDGTSIDALIAGIVSRFEISEEHARAEVESLLRDFESRNLLNCVTN